MAHIVWSFNNCKLKVQIPKFQFWPHVHLGNHCVGGGFKLEINMAGAPLVNLIFIGLFLQDIFWIYRTFYTFNKGLFDVNQVSPWIVKELIIFKAHMLREGLIFLCILGILSQMGGGWGGVLIISHFFLFSWPRPNFWDKPKSTFY